MSIAMRAGIPYYLAKESDTGKTTSTSLAGLIQTTSISCGTTSYCDSSMSLHPIMIATIGSSPPHGQPGARGGRYRWLQGDSKLGCYKFGIIVERSEVATLVERAAHVGICERTWRPDWSDVAGILQLNLH